MVGGWIFDTGPLFRMTTVLYSYIYIYIPQGRTHLLYRKKCIQHQCTKAHGKRMRMGLTSGFCSSSNCFLCILNKLICCLATMIRAEYINAWLPDYLWQVVSLQALPQSQNQTLEKLKTQQILQGLYTSTPPHLPDPLSCFFFFRVWLQDQASLV